MRNLYLSRVEESAPKSRWSGGVVASRRIGHGGMVWSAQGSLQQPQDGAFNNDREDHENREGRMRVGGRVTDISTRLQLAAFGPVVPVEPEDARITGGTRSLVRRLLGLNLRPRVSLAAALGAIPAAVVKPAKRVCSAVKSAQVA